MRRCVFGRCRTSKSVGSLDGEGVTRIPGAAVHVGLIDSQRRRARVTRHQLHGAYAHGQRARARFMRTKADYASKTRERGGRVTVIFNSFMPPV